MRDDRDTIDLATGSSTPLANLDEVRETLNDFIQHTNTKFDRLHNAIRSSEETAAAIVDAYYEQEAKTNRVQDKLIAPIDVNTEFARKLEHQLDFVSREQLDEAMATTLESVNQQDTDNVDFR